MESQNLENVDSKLVLELKTLLQKIIDLETEKEYYKHIYNDLVDRQTEWVLCDICFTHSNIDTSIKCFICYKTVCQLCNSKNIFEMETENENPYMNKIILPICSNQCYMTTLE